MFNILNTKLYPRVLKTGATAAIAAALFSFSPMNVESADAQRAFTAVGHPTSVVGPNFQRHRYYNRRHFNRRFHGRKYFRRHHRGIRIGIGGGYYGGGYYGGGYPVPVPVVRQVPVPQPVYCPIPVPVAPPSYGGGYGGGAAVGPVYRVFGAGGC